MESFYWNSDQPIEIFNTTLIKVHDCINIASKYGGRVFGGFVRNVLIPHLSGHQSPGYKDVDIWFQSVDKVVEFLKEMDSSIVFNRHSSRDARCKEDYPFERDQYLLTDKIATGPVPKDGIIIDIIIADELPVDDLNINKLTYSTIFGFQSQGEETAKELITMIENKTAFMLPIYAGITCGHPRYTTKHKRIDLLARMGWKFYSKY